MSVKDNELDDRELIERFKRTGNLEWFAPLFERYQGRIYAIAYHMLRNRALAEDLVQETFQKALREIGQFDGMIRGGNFLGWLRTICRNLCISTLRKNSRTQEADVVDLPDRERAPMENETLFQQLEAELKAMEEGPRRCWLLFNIEGYTYEEIAERTGYSLPEVKNFLRVAREKLRKRLR